MISWQGPSRQAAFTGRIHSAAQKYIEAGQQTEPSNWEFVKELFAITNQIEWERVKKSGKQTVVLDADGIAKFLDEEIALAPRQQRSAGSKRTP